MLSNQTSILPGWLLAGNRKVKPLNWYYRPFTQEDFDKQQRLLRDAPREARQRTISRVFVRNCAVIAEILISAAEKGKFDFFAARLRTELGKLCHDLTGGRSTIFGTALLTPGTFSKPTRPNLDGLLDGFEKRLKSLVQTSKSNSK